MREINYYVVPEKKIVIAKAERKAYEDTFDEIIGKCSSSVVNSILTTDFPFRESIFEEKYFTGTAICAEEDTFDESVGKDIAACKVDMKYHKTISHKYKLMSKYLLKMADEINKLADQHDKKVDNIQNDIERRYMGI